MKRSLRSRAFLALPIVAAAACSSVFDPQSGPSRERAAPGADAGIGIRFKDQIRPLMERPSDSTTTPHGCKHCHYPGVETQQGVIEIGLDLSSLGALRKGGIDSAPSSATPILDVAHPENSALIQKLRGVFFHGVRMPKNGPPYWTDAEISLVLQWIREGAKGADDE